MDIIDIDDEKKDNNGEKAPKVVKETSEFPGKKDWTYDKISTEHISDPDVVRREYEEGTKHKVVVTDQSYKEYDDGSVDKITTKASYDPSSVFHFETDKDGKQLIKNGVGPDGKAYAEITGTKTTEHYEGTPPKKEEKKNHSVAKIITAAVLLLALAATALSLRSCKKTEYEPVVDPEPSITDVTPILTPSSTTTDVFEGLTDEQIQIFYVNLYADVCKALDGGVLRTCEDHATAERDDIIKINTHMGIDPTSGLLPYHDVITDSIVVPGAAFLEECAEFEKTGFVDEESFDKAAELLAQQANWTDRAIGYAEAHYNTTLECINRGVVTGNTQRLYESESELTKEEANALRESKQDIQKALYLLTNRNDIVAGKIPSVTDSFGNVIIMTPYGNITYSANAFNNVQSNVASSVSVDDTIVNTEDSVSIRR